MASVPQAPTQPQAQNNKRISSFDQYLLTYLPRSQEVRQAQALSPQEFGVSIARDSLDQLRQSLAQRRAAA